MTADKHNVEADLEGFTEADMENLEFVLEDIEELRAEFTQSMGLETIDPEYVAEQLLRTFRNIVGKLIRKIMSNSRTRPKLLNAILQGPAAVNKLVMPVVTKMLPSYFRWLAPIYVPIVAPLETAGIDPIRP